MQEGSAKEEHWAQKGQGKDACTVDVDGFGFGTYKEVLEWRTQAAPGSVLYEQDIGSGLGGADDAQQRQYRMSRTIPLASHAITDKITEATFDWDLIL